MTRILTVSFVVGLLLLPKDAEAKDASVTPAKTKAPATATKDASVKKTTDGSVAKELVGGVKKIIKKAKQVKSKKDDAGNKIPLLIAIWALLAALFKFLLSVVKLLSKWFKTGTGKTVLRISTLVLGVLTFLVTKLAMQMVWYEALWLALSGPGALMVHELTLLIPWLKKLKEKTES